MGGMGAPNAFEITLRSVLAERSPDGRPVVFVHREALELAEE